MKLALCIKKEDLIKHIPEVDNENICLSIALDQYPELDLNEFETVLEDRSTCETDERFLQLIPYVTLLGKKDGEPCVYVYSRGQVGESRLSGKCSLGVGGHIEKVDLDDASEMFSGLTLPEGIEAPTPQTLDFVAYAIVRELKEELGLDLMQYIVNIRDSLSQSQLIYNTTDEVGKVHLGIGTAVNVGEAVDFAIDGVEVVKGEWVSVDNFFDANNIELETWSKVVLVSMANSFNLEREHAIEFYQSKLKEAQTDYTNEYVNLNVLENSLDLALINLPFIDEPVDDTTEDETVE